MTRKAILIGSPGTPYLAGVEVDLINMKNFLSSANGGSWNLDTEIVEFNLNPTYSEIEPHLINLQYCDFALVYYSGHGFTDNDNQGQINLNTTEIVPVMNLANRCNKQITIIDACRGYPKQLNAIGSIKPSPISFENINPEYAKALFENYLNHCPNGKVLLYASQLGQNASDTNNGGYFSTNLLLTTKKIAKKAPKPVVKIIEVFNQTYLETKNRHQPEIVCTDNSALNLPFAVNSNIQIPVKNPNTMPQPVTTLGDITSVAFGTIAVVGLTILIAEILTGGNKK